MSWQDDALKMVALAAQAKTLIDELAELAESIIERVEIVADEGAEVTINITDGSG
tara:strand:+ start:19 stop:183 length:165 start_codon:yes stop_codon:yes gene_type:complete